MTNGILDVARRAALAGYLALAPDGLSSAGGAPADQEAARDLFQKTDPAKIAGDVIAGVPFLAAHPECTGKVGSVGFCYGGSMALPPRMRSLTRCVALWRRCVWSRTRWSS